MLSLAQAMFDIRDNRLHLHHLHPALLGQALAMVPPMVLGRAIAWLPPDDVQDIIAEYVVVRAEPWVPLDGPFGVPVLEEVSFVELVDALAEVMHGDLAIALCHLPPMTLGEVMDALWEGMQPPHRPPTPAAHEVLPRQDSLPELPLLIMPAPPMMEEPEAPGTPNRQE